MSSVGGAVAFWSGEALRDQSEAARLSGLNRTYLGRLITKYNLPAKGR